MYYTIKIWYLLQCLKHHNFEIQTGIVSNHMVHCVFLGSNIQVEVNKPHRRTAISSRKPSFSMLMHRLIGDKLNNRSWHEANVSPSDCRSLYIIFIVFYSYKLSLINYKIWQVPAVKNYQNKVLLHVDVLLSLPRASTPTCVALKSLAWPHHHTTYVFSICSYQLTCMFLTVFVWFCRCLWSEPNLNFDSISATGDRYDVDALSDIHGVYARQQPSVRGRWSRPGKPDGCASFFLCCLIVGTTNFRYFGQIEFGKQPMLINAGYCFDGISASGECDTKAYRSEWHFISAG